MTSRPPRRPSGGRPGFLVRTAATMPKAISTWNRAWTLTSGSTGRWLVPSPGRQTMGDAGHWLGGRVAVGPGAHRGSGAATAAAIAAAGAQVVLAARDRDALDGVASHLRPAGGEATPVPPDRRTVR